MSLLKKLSNNVAGAKDEKDSVGGTVDTGLYTAKITMAYLTSADSGAVALTTHFKTEEGFIIKDTTYITSGTAKGGKNTYKDKDGKEQYLPGYNSANSLSRIVTGKDINDLDTEEKLVNVYNFEAGAEVPTKVEVIMDMLNKEILIGVFKQETEKTAKNDAGDYIGTGEFRTENVINKYFHPDSKMTSSEIQAKAENALFVDTWHDKWKGKVNVVKAKKSGVGGTAGAPTPSTPAAGKPKESLFSKPTTE